MVYFAFSHCKFYPSHRGKRQVLVHTIQLFSPCEFIYLLASCHLSVNFSLFVFVLLSDSDRISHSCDFPVRLQSFENPLYFHEMCRKCVGNVYEMCRKCVWNVYEMCMKCVWNVYEMCMECVWNVPVRFSVLAENSKGQMLSFAVKAYSQRTEARITAVSCFGNQKRFDPQKYYVYILKVFRENQREPAFVFRSYPELIELYEKLCMMFPTAKWTHPLSRGVRLGRSNVKNVAQKRQTDVQLFLQSLTEQPEDVFHVSTWLSRRILLFDSL